MGCTTRGGDSIHTKKRLLAITVIGAALLLSTVLIVSLKGNDKPEITTNPPEDEQPASTPQPAVYFSNDLDDYDDYKVKRHYSALIPQTAPSDSEGDDEDDDDADEGNGNGNGNGQSDAKTHGLERAIEVHLRNMERQDAKMNENAKSHDSNGKGIENSMAHLLENLEKQESRT